MRKLILAIILFILASSPTESQGPIYLPVILRGANPVTTLPQPILRIRTNDGKIVDLLEDWEISDPYWRPQIAGYKNDGDYVDSAIADGRRLVSKKYSNVVETIPLVARGTDQSQAIKRIRELLQAIRQAADYWTEPYEYDYAWLEVRPACNDCRTGYARIVKANVPELNNPYGQPFFSATNQAVMDDITLVVEREPLWRGVQPGTIIGPLYNLIKNPDFELWNFGVTDSQPDSWSDLESAGITGANSRESDNHSGNYALEVRVSQSTAANRFKGVSQVIASTRANTTYTIVAWVRNDGVSNGVGRILVTYSSQLEIYRSSSKHGWTLYTGTFTTGAADTVAISLEILTIAANTDGTVYFDSIMLLEDDWEQEAIEGMLPYMTSSHIVNHWDQAGSTLLEAGDLNYVDMWDIPGDESALVKLEMVNNTPDSGTNSPVVFQTVRAGMRRARDVEEFTNFYDPPGIPDTTASGDDRVNSGTLSTLWTTVGFYVINDPNIIRDNLGRFRVLARVWDTSTSGDFNLEVRLRYWIGQSGINVKTLDSVIVPGRGSWYIVDLTSNVAMNWDIKTKNLPGSLGFEIQMRRATGSSEGRLDYVMVLPTDGGILFANVSPSVPLDSGLVVDNTNSSDVYGARLVRGWRQVYQTTTEQPFLENFNGALYIGELGSGLYRFQNNGGVSLADYGGGNFIPLEVYNNRLFVPTQTGGVGQTYSTDGNSFLGTAEFTFGAAVSIPLDCKALQGYLYITGETTNVAKIWRWDGAAATATEILTGGATYSEFKALGVYRNKLYIHADRSGSNDIDVVEYDPVTSSFSVSLTIAGGAVQLDNVDFVEFNGFLYWLTGTGTDLIYRFDGSNWTTAEPFDTGATGPSAMFWHAGVVAGDRFYVTGRQTFVTAKARVMSTNDGVNWITEYLPDTTSATAGIAMATSQGQVFMGTAPNTLHAITFAENQYKVADYQLSEFKAPNREWGNSHRHRYFFSYDRENGVNVADDAMLVGIGIVPQYLSLVGNEAN